MKVHVIGLDGKVQSCELPEEERLLYRYAQDQIKGSIEYVAMLFNDQRATLIVNDRGASLDPTINPEGQLHPNARATAIYWTASMIGRTPAPFNPLEMPMIHGVAVLAEVDKRKL